MGEDIVVSFGGLVAGEASLEHRFVGRFAAVNLRKSPAAREAYFCESLTIN